MYATQGESDKLRWAQDGKVYERGKSLADNIAIDAAASRRWTPTRKQLDRIFKMVAKGNAGVCRLVTWLAMQL